MPRAYTGTAGAKRISERATHLDAGAARWPRRPWWKLHASTWVVVALVLTVFVILAVPAYREIPRDEVGPRAVRGWPLAVLEQDASSSRLLRVLYVLMVIECDRPQWLLASAWLYDGGVLEGSVSLAAAVADVTIALCTAAGIALTLEARHRRHRSAWQFHLSDLLVATLFVALIAGWYAAWLSGWRKEEAAENALTRREWATGSTFAVRQYAGPHWLLRLFGESAGEPFARVTKLFCHQLGAEQCRCVVEQLPRFRYLTTLKMDSCHGTERLFKSIAQPAALADVSVRDSHITPALLRALPNDLGIKRLDLSDSRIAEDALDALAQLPRLEDLDLSDAQLADGALRPVQHLARLRVLNLDRTKVCDADLAYLGKLASLEELELISTSVTDAGMPHLRSLRRLKTLGLGFTGVTPDGIAELQKSLPDLKIDRGF